MKLSRRSFFKSLSALAALPVLGSDKPKQPDNEVIYTSLKYTSQYGATISGCWDSEICEVIVLSDNQAYGFDVVNVIDNIDPTTPVDIVPER